MIFLACFFLISAIIRQKRNDRVAERYNPMSCIKYFNCFKFGSHLFDYDKIEFQDGFLQVYHDVFITISALLFDFRIDC